MGQSISDVRNNAIAQAKAQKDETLERLDFLEKMAKSHLQANQAKILQGERNDHEIHAGTIVEQLQKVHVTTSEKSKIGKEVSSAVGDLFSGDIAGGIEKIVNLTCSSILGNTSAGEFEAKDMFILWSDNALLRVDYYFWRYNFSGGSIITDIEGVSAYCVIKQVLDWEKIDPQIITYAISRFYAEDDVKQVMSEITATAKTIKTIKQAAASIPG